MSARKIHRFDEVIGHGRVLSYVKKCLDKDRTPDVVILYGSPGVGKSAIAKLWAIDTVTKFKPELKDKYTIEVIDKDNSTDSIKLFNMSEIQEKEEEIQGVIAELSIGMSVTGRKALILDEAHGMSKAAQDAILTRLEYLPKGVYVFICTSEIGILREALVQRAQAPLLLSDLTTSEMNVLVKRIIRDKNLSFNFNQQVAVSLIATWSKNRPRKAEQLLANFEDNTCVSADELSIFINTNIIPEVIKLVEYLYGSMTLGIEYIESLKMTPEFKDALIQVLKVALGSSSNMVSADDSRYIRDFFMDKEIMHLLKFVQQVTGMTSLTRARITSAYINSHVNYCELKEVPTKRTQEEITSDDFLTLNANAEESNVNVAVNEDCDMNIPSIAELMSLGKSIENGF